MKHRRHLAKISVILCIRLSIDRNGKWINPLFLIFSHNLMTMSNTLSSNLWMDFQFSGKKWYLFIPFIWNSENLFSYMKFMKILQTFYLSTTIHLKLNFHCLKNALEMARLYVRRFESEVLIATFERKKILAFSKRNIVF